jgi:hypothetical protein
MANATNSLQITTVGGPGPFNFDLPVKGTTKVYKGTLGSQLTATRMLVPYSTAASGVVVGVIQHDADNLLGADGAKRAVVESNRMFEFAGAGFTGDAVMIGSVVYGVDDNTVSASSAAGTRKPVGFYYGTQENGNARVLVNPSVALIVAALQGLADTPATADALRDAIVAAFG